MHSRTFGTKSSYSHAYMQAQPNQFSGRRMYDMCMVFKNKTSRNVKFDEGLDMDYSGGPKLDDPDPEDLADMQSWKLQRESILKSLQNCGLEIYCYYSRDRSHIICKIGAGAQKLRDAAHRMKYKLQLKPEYLSAYAQFRHDFPGSPELNFTDRRVVSHFYQNYSGKDFPTEDSIFSTLDKILIINHIIVSRDKDCAGINVANMLHRNSHLVAYFPLHEDKKLLVLKKSFYNWILMEEHYSTNVREYFGDKIAFYFLWQSFYAKWLVPLAIIGLALQLVDLLARTPDNITAVPFCVLVSIWALFLPHFWRRQQAKYAIDWGSHLLKETLEPCRPEHYGDFRLNPVTAEVEPHYPWEKRVRHYIFSGVVMAFVGAFVVCTIFGLLFARHQMKSQVVGGIVGFQFLLALTVEINNLLLTGISSRLTRWENHRTQSEHDYHMLAKSVAFKFINSFLALYYIGFFKTHVVLFGEQLQCIRDDCFLDLQSQLAIFVLFRMLIGNAVEFLLPPVKLLWRSWHKDSRYLKALFRGANRVELADMSAAEQQANQDEYDSFADSDESLISHGYATLFAVTSPWVCSAALLGVLLETYIDMRSATESKRRAMPVTCRDNEPWSTAFEVYGVLVAFTNVFLMIFSSDLYQYWTLTEKLVLFTFLVHFIFLSRLLITSMLPATPKSVDNLRLKQEVVVHRCLENIKNEPSQDFSMFREQRAAEFEVFEQDRIEDEDAEEPELDLGASGRSMCQSVLENAPLISSTRTLRSTGY